MISKLKQIENYPTGDCVRTVFACLLGYDNPEAIPNFMANGNEEFEEKMLAWLDENNLSFIEISLEEFHKAEFTPIGYCTVSGKSPRGEWDHMVVGEVKLRKENDLKYRDLYLRHDTSPFHDGKYIDGDVTLVGFLVRKL